MDVEAKRGDTPHRAPARRADTVQRVLAAYEFWERLDHAHRAALSQVATAHTLADGTLLVEAGRSCGDVLLVGRGSVRTFVCGDSGREVTLYESGAGESCPANLAAAFYDRPAGASVAAVGCVEAVTVPSGAFRGVAAGSPALRDFVLEALSGRFETMIGLLREITTRRVDERLADYLLQRFDEEPSAQPVIETTQEDIARSIGSAREVVSRRLRELERDGVVHLARGRIALANRAALARSAGGRRG